MSWRETTLDEFVKRKEVDIQTGPFGTQLKASDYTEVGTPVINVRNIGYGELRPEKLEFVPEVVLSRLSKHQLQHRDIVFGRKGAVDRHLYVEDDYAGWMQGSDCIRLRVHTDELSPKFVSYFLLRESHKQWMLNQCSNKATMASLNQDVICRIPLKLPPIGTQKAIADILSAYDALIENNRRRMALLEESARLLYREWFVHLRFPGHEHVPITDGVPEGWERVRLKDLTTKIGSGATPKGGEGAYKDEGITLIRSLNVYDYRFDESGLAFIDDTQASKLANVVVEPNDVLLNITGASVGRCCMVQDRHLPARVNQHVMIIRAAPDLSLLRDREKADITDIIRELHGVVDEAIETKTLTVGEERFGPYDISKIDFDRLRMEFERSKKKNTTVQSLKTAIELKLQRLLAQNPARTNFQKHYEEIVAEYNREKNRVTIEKTFEALFVLLKGLDEEEDRAIQEGLDQETLALFDLLKKPELTQRDIKRIKEVAVELLAALKAEKLKVAHWREKEATRDAVRLAIHNFLWSDETGLPVDSYEELEVVEKVDEVFRHVYRVYPEIPSSVYQGAA